MRNNLCRAVARFGLQAHGIAALGVALFAPVSLSSRMWLLTVLVAVACWLAYLSLSGQQPAWWRRTAACLALSTTLVQLTYYLRAGGPEIAAAVTAPVLLIGAVTAAVLLPARTEWSNTEEAESGTVPSRRPAWAAVSLVTLGLLVLLVVLAAFSRGTDSTSWGIPSTALMWCSLAHSGLSRHDPIRTGAAALCGALHAPAMTAWFYPIALGLPRPWLLGMVVIGLYAAIVLACAYLSGPTSRSTPGKAEPPPSREPRPSGPLRQPPDTATSIRWDVTP